eukprot:TRINITY_DN60503_c0_g1_i1.p1 TRINITY_DN60503_c0_g1~~TRINITY_DN60503_c0_g1_i1.p1  ORF type:complete len:457 (+),score=145.59 TRINITY_DN60503_c0_g1_i1:81-1373(+)
MRLLRPAAAAALALAAAAADSDEDGSRFLGEWRTADGASFTISTASGGSLRFEQDGVYGTLEPGDSRPPPSVAPRFDAGYVADLDSPRGPLGTIWIALSDKEIMHSVFEGQGTSHKAKAVRASVAEAAIKEMKAQGAAERTPGASQQGGAAGAAGFAADPFLESNAQRTEVVQLPSGLQYRVLREGDGQQRPGDKAEVVVAFEARTGRDYAAGGGPYDSSYARQRNDTLHIGRKGLVLGLSEALGLMVQGDQWEVFVPAHLGYNPRLGGYESPQFPQAPGWVYRAQGTVVFKIELLDIKGATLPAQRCRPSQLLSCTERERGFIAKQQGRTEAEQQAELVRLLALLDTKLAPGQRDWVRQRLALLRRLGVSPPPDGVGWDSAAGEGAAAAAQPEDEDEEAGEGAAAGAPTRARRTASEARGTARSGSDEL